MYTIEKAIKEMPEGVSQMVWMIDFKGFSISSSPPISQCMEILNVLSNHYPERLGLAFIIDTPFIFNVFCVIIYFKNLIFRKRFLHLLILEQDKKQFLLDQIVQHFSNILILTNY